MRISTANSYQSSLDALVDRKANLDQSEQQLNEYLDELAFFAEVGSSEFSHSLSVWERCTRRGEGAARHERSRRTQ